MTFVVKGRHVLATLLGFFGVTVAVNAAFVTYALDTFTGEDVPRPYLRGLAYNETLSAHAAQAKLGWRAIIDVERSGQGAAIDVVLSDKAGAPQNGLTLSLAFRRPTDAAFDRSFALTGSGDGRYSVRVAAIAAGQWDVVARTTAPDGTPFEATRRVVLK
jgi:nitrogen fixation protein FixH